MKNYLECRMIFLICQIFGGVERFCADQDNETQLYLDNCIFEQKNA